MVSFRLKVGPKGQIVIPKVFRETYKIREGGYVFIKPEKDGILIRGVEDPDKLIEWIRERRMRVKGLKGKLGELSNVDLEGEFED